MVALKVEVVTPRCAAARVKLPCSTTIAKAFNSAKSLPRIMAITPNSLVDNTGIIKQFSAGYHPDKCDYAERGNDHGEI